MLKMVEGSMVGHNGPPVDVALTDSIILALMRAVMQRKDLKLLDKAVRWVTLMSVNDAGTSMMSVKALSEAVGHGRAASVRQARDKMVGDGFEEVIGPRSVRGLQVSLEDEITAYCDSARHGSDCTTSHSSDRTRLPGSDCTRTAQGGSDGPRLPGSNCTRSSRTRVSYPGDIENISLSAGAREERTWTAMEMIGGASYAEAWIDESGKLKISQRMRDEFISDVFTESDLEDALLEIRGDLTKHDIEKTDFTHKVSGQLARKRRLRRNYKEDGTERWRQGRELSRKENTKSNNTRTKEDLLKYLK